MVSVDLRLGDCLEILPTLPAGSVGLMVFSPPYNCRRPYGTFKDEMPWPDYYTWIERVIAECYRVIELGGVIAINVPTVIRWQVEHEFAHTWGDFDPTYKTHRNGKRVTGKGGIEPLGIRLFEQMEATGFKMREPIVWVKGNDGEAICPHYKMGSDSDPRLRSVYELILLGSKGRWFHRGGTGRRSKEAIPALEYTKDVWFIPMASTNGHPAPFPEELPSRLIKLFAHARNSVICDPFMGKGTSGLAALKLNRPFIGCEIDPVYCAIAKKRIREAQMQMTMELGV